MHRYHSHWQELGQRLIEFRSHYGMTPAEVARVVRAGDNSTVAQWQSGIDVPEGIRRERLIELLEGRLWPELRVAAIVGEGLPESWERAVHSYRRASRERQAREADGVLVAAVLEHLRTVDSPEGLRWRYGEHDFEAA